MDRWMKGIWFSGALAVLAAAPAEAKTKISVSGAIEVATPEAGLSSDAAKSAVESKLQWAEACGDVEKAGTHKVALSVDGNGAVTAVERLETTLPDALAACVDGVLKEVRTAALEKPDSTSKLTVVLALEPEATPAAAGAAPASDTPPEAPTVSHADPAAGSTGVSSLTGEAADTKPWSILAQLSTSLGAGTFVSDEFARAPYFGWALSLRGSYKVTDLITASARTDLSQELTESNTSPESTVPRQFLMAETRLGASTTGLYKEEQYTGIEADLGTSIRLPTDLAAQAAGRVFGWVFAGTLKRTFKDLGPGDLEVTYVLAYRENFGPRAADLRDQTGTRFAICRSSDDCAGPANTARSLTNNLILAYTFLENFTATLDVAVRNDFRWGLAGSDVSGFGLPISSSPNAAVGSVNQSDLVFSTIELAYTINEMFAVAGGITTIADPFVKDPDGPGYNLRFPLFDFKDTPYNTSNYYLALSFTY